MAAAREGGACARSPGIGTGSRLARSTRSAIELIGRRVNIIPVWNGMLN